MKLFPQLADMVGPTMPAWIWGLCLFLILLPILLILFIAFYSKKIRHQQIMSAMEKGLPLADFMPKPLTDKQIGIRNLSAGIGFLLIGLFLVGIWYYAIEAPNIPVISNWVPVVGAVIAGMGILFLCRGLLQMQSSDIRVPWYTKLAIGIGLLFIGLVLAVIWWYPIYIPNTGMPILDQKILIIAGVISGIGILFLCMGLYHRQSLGMSIPWFTKVAAGIGLWFIGLSLIIVWWMGKTLIGMHSINQGVLIVAGVILGLGLMLLLTGILQKKSDKQKTEKNISNID